MNKLEPKRQQDRLLSVAFITAAIAAMQRARRATVVELATIMDWRRVDVEEMLLGASCHMHPTAGFANQPPRSRRGQPVKAPQLGRHRWGRSIHG